MQNAKMCSIVPGDTFRDKHTSPAIKNSLLECWDRCNAHCCQSMALPLDVSLRRLRVTVDSRRIVNPEEATQAYLSLNNNKKCRRRH